MPLDGIPVKVEGDKGSNVVVGHTIGGHQVVVVSR